MSSGAATGAATDGRPPDGVGPRVLVLEDEVLILMGLEFELEDAGMRPVTATSAAGALDIIDREVPDVAVLDVNLGNGTTCEPVAAKLDELGVPFVLHSGDLSRRGEFITRFDVPVIPKPAPGDQIAAALRALRAPAA